MANKMVTDRSADASFVNAAAATFTQEVSPALGEVLSPLVGEGESMPDVTTLAALAARLVEQRLERLIEADKANIDAQAELIEPRQQRDQAFEQANRTIFGIRDICRGLYGREMSARIVPDESRIPQRPKAFLHMAEHVLERLQDLERELPEQSLQGIAVERVDLSSNFETALEGLDEALAEVDLKRRGAEITQAAKNDAMSEFNVIYSASIRLLEALSILAGKPELASRIRPTRRRRSSGDGSETTDETANAAESSVESD